MTAADSMTGPGTSAYSGGGSMRTLGLIGGMSWESTALYYAGVNRGVAERRGGHRSAPLLIASVDFQYIVDCQQGDRWDEAGAHLAELARSLERAGAEAIALAVNTMHKVAAPIRDAIGIPFLDIRQAVADTVVATGADRVLLLGTNYVTRQAYYAGDLRERLGGHDTVVLLPEAEQDFVHGVIYDELCNGVVNETARERIAAAIGESSERENIDAVCLACTELPMLHLEALLPGLRIADSTGAHVAACLDFIVGELDS